MNVAPMRTISVALAGSMLAFAGSALAKDDDLDSVTLKAGDDKVKIAAIEDKSERIDLILYLKKGRKFKELDNVRAPGASVDEGKVKLSADSESRGRGEGQLKQGDDYRERFEWDVRKKRIDFI